MKHVIYNKTNTGEWVKVKVNMTTTPPTIITLPMTLFEKLNGYAK